MKLRTFHYAFATLVVCACSNPPPTNDASIDNVTVDTADVSTTPDATIPIDVPPRIDVVPDYLRPPQINRTMPETALAAQRTSCAFHAGDWPAATLGTDIPVGTDIPIDHVIVIMQENRSFDSYYSKLPAYNTAHALPAQTIEVAPDDFSNPSPVPDGGVIQRHHDTTQYCFTDVNHEWDGTHGEWDNGANDGFARENATTSDPTGARSLFYYDDTDIPFYYSLASTFAIADHYFASVLGPTYPNRFFSLSGTSRGYTYNSVWGSDTRANPTPQIFLEMDQAGLDWRAYAGSAPSIALFINYYLHYRTTSHFGALAQLMTDMQNNTLPPLSWIEAPIGGAAGDESDEHPPGVPMNGEHLIEGIVRALIASPSWAHTALFITYDEHGGFADHVPPPTACPPDNIAPITSDQSATPYLFDHYGFRVPFIVVSPYAKAHYVSHNVYDHTSILRFIQARFGLPAMTARDANATPPMDMFDFTQPPLLTVPTLAPGRVDTDVNTRCNTLFPGT